MNGYLYDPHTHTAETSKCGHLFAADVVDRYVRNGFSGLVVTDHLHPEYLSRIDTQHNWDMVMDHYLSGYHASKKRGDEVGLDVMLGAEFRFPENDNDYLVYGIDEQWLRSNPYACCMSAQEFYDKFHNEVLIIHAHPFRAGVILPQRVKDSRAYKHMIETMQFQLWCPEFPDILAADAEMRKENNK